MYLYTRRHRCLCRYAHLCASACPARAEVPQSDLMPPHAAPSPHRPAAHTGSSRAAAPPAEAPGVRGFVGGGMFDPTPALLRPVGRDRYLGFNSSIP